MDVKDQLADIYGDAIENPVTPKAGGNIDTAVTDAESVIADVDSLMKDMQEQPTSSDVDARQCLKVIDLMEAESLRDMVFGF